VVDLVQGTISNQYNVGSVQNQIYLRNNMMRECMALLSIGDQEVLQATHDGASPACHEPVVADRGARTQPERASGKELAKQQYYQRRAAQARRSHTKTRKALLKKLGIEVERIKSCLPPPGD
jgi:hypothetical protein